MCRIVMLASLLIAGWPAFASARDGIVAGGPKRHVARNVVKQVVKRRSAEATVPPSVLGIRW
jgi:hypothetical protein